MTTIAIVILSALVLGALAKGVYALFWSQSDEGQVELRGRKLGWW